MQSIHGTIRPADHDRVATRFLSSSFGVKAKDGTLREGDTTATARSAPEV